jgi:hypothetical protein
MERRDNGGKRLGRGPYGFILPGRPETRILMGEKPVSQGNFLKDHHHACDDNPGHGDRFLAAVPDAVNLPLASEHSNRVTTHAIA